MYERSAVEPRPSILASGAIVILSVMLASASPANPLPASALLIHVHSWDPSFCQENSITECGQVIQYAEIEGDVEFDVFLANPYGFIGQFTDASMTIFWPDAWQFTTFEDCIGGEVTLNIGSHQADVQIGYEQPISPGSWLLIGRVRAQVSGFGGLDFTNVGFSDQFWGTVGPALAGVECSYTYLSCYDLMSPCGAHFTPDQFQMHVPQGEIASGTLDVRTGWNGGYPCPVQYLETADWMELDVTWDEYYYLGLMTVTVDASGLCPGTYQAVIRAVSQVLTCVPVTIYVEPVASVPDTNPVMQIISWGGMKEKYR